MSSQYIFQHDANFVSYGTPTHTHQLPSPEDFFVRKFTNDYNSTSIIMRQEEKLILENLLSSPIANKSGNLHRFRIHDYLTLCRGKSLVRMIFFWYFKDCSISYTFDISIN